MVTKKSCFGLSRRRGWAESTPPPPHPPLTHYSPSHAQHTPLSHPRPFPGGGASSATAVGAAAGADAAPVASVGSEAGRSCPRRPRCRTALAFGQQALRNSNTKIHDQIRATTARDYRLANIALHCGTFRFRV